MRPSHRQVVHLLLVVPILVLAACASSSGRARSDDPVFEEGDHAPRDDDQERLERERIERERAERDRIERNTPSREMEGAAYPAAWGRRTEAPDVRVWIENGESTYTPGDRVRALFRVDDDAYVTIVRVDTDGRMRVLFPRSPRESAWVRGEHSYRVPGSSAGSFVVDDPTGLGYVFAITSYERFDYSRVAYGREWDYEAIGYRVSGDPFVAVRRFADRISIDDRAGYATAYDEYYVGRHVEYPRYACYDCHSAGSYPVHDPYGYPCPRVHVVVYSDPYYYPYRHYPGTRVVYAARPRYVFKEGGAATPTAGGSSSGASGGSVGGTLVEHRRRDEDADLRRPGSPTSDPNIQPRVAENPGATRPGDDVQATVQGGRRRVDDERATPVVAPREGLGTPRRDPESTPATGTGTGGGGTGGSSGGGASDDAERPGPRRDPGGQSADRPEDPPSRRDDAREDQRRRAGDQPRGEDPRRDEPRNEPRNEPRTEPRTEPRSDAGGERRGSAQDAAPATNEGRRDDRSSQSDGEGRRGLPRFDPPRDAGTGSESPRYDPRRSSSGGESGGARRSEPQVEARAERRSEPRSEPKTERRSEPKTERRSEPKSEPRSEAKTESKRDGGGSRSSRRRPD